MNKRIIILLLNKTRPGEDEKGNKKSMVRSWISHTTLP